MAQSVILHLNQCHQKQFPLHITVSSVKLTLHQRLLGLLGGQIWLQAKINLRLVAEQLQSWNYRTCGALWREPWSLDASRKAGISRVVVFQDYSLFPP